MHSRIPLTVAVVGALLVGGATTGSTRASWIDHAPLPSSSVSAGQMSYTATTPAGVTVDKVAGSTADTTFVLDDTSLGRNLTQRITASVGATTTTDITATVATTCGGSTSFVDMTPTSADQTFCVRVTSSTTAVGGDVTINLSSAQRPTAGWTTPTITRTVAVTVNDPETLVLQCDSSVTPAPAYRVKWEATGATSYKVYSSASAATGFTLVATVTSPTTFTATGWAQNEIRYLRITAVTGATESSSSNTLKVDRSGASNNFTCGSPS